MDVGKLLMIGLLTTLVVVSVSQEEGEEPPVINVLVTVDDQPYVNCVIYTAAVNDSSCEPPEKPLHGHYETGGLVYNDGDTIRYHCHTGHRLIGEQVRTCNGTSKQWQPQEPHCQPEYVDHVLTRLSGAEDNATAIERRITAVENKTEDMGENIAAIEKRVTAVENSASAMGNTMSTIENKVSTLVNNNNNVENRLSSLEASMAADQATLMDLIDERRPNNTWKIAGLCERLNEEESGEMLSPVFVVPGYKRSAQTRIRWNTHEDDFKFELSFKENTRHNALNIKEFPLVVYVIVDQSETRLEHDLTVIGFHYVNSPTLNYDTFGFDHGTKLSKVKKEWDRYCVNDVTIIKTSVEDPEQATESVQSYNGRLRWTIDHWSVRRSDETEQWREFQYSDPFYSGRPGYKMRLVLYVSGDGDFKGKAVTIGMRILKGRWDSLLPDQMTFKTRITMRDQSYNLFKEDFTLNSVDRAGKRGGYYVGQIPYDSIVDDVHLIDDSISIKVEVESS